MVQFDVVAALRRQMVPRLTDKLAATTSNGTTSAVFGGLAGKGRVEWGSCFSEKEFGGDAAMVVERSKQVLRRTL
jgi:hypothetical protein